MPAGSDGRAVDARAQRYDIETHVAPGCWLARRDRRSIQRRLARATSRSREPVRSFVPAMLSLIPPTSPSPPPRETSASFGVAPPGFAANEKKPRNLKVSGLPTSPLSVLRRIAAELDQAGLFRMQRQRERPQPFAHIIPEAPGVGLCWNPTMRSSAYRIMTCRPWPCAVASARPRGQKRSGDRCSRAAVKSPNPARSPSLQSLRPRLRGPQPAAISG